MEDHEINLLNILAQIVSSEHIIVSRLRLSLFAVLWYIPPRNAKS